MNIIDINKQDGLFWYFPPTYGGIEDGPSNAEIETFTGNPIESLGREICQNSLDANISADRPTIVEFRSFEIRSEEILGLKTLSKIALAMKNSPYSQDDKKSKQIIDNLSDLVSSKGIVKCLRISDHNTCGLTVQASELGKDSVFHIFTKTRGRTDKYGSEGGSFGIGRNVIYALSDVRMIFLSTVDLNQDTASLGIIKTMTFEDEDGNRKQGCGFYGIDNGQPIKKQVTIGPNSFREKEDTGLDIYIICFNGPDDWHKELSNSIIDSFFYAIHKGKLVVTIKNNDDTITINSDTLATQLQMEKQTELNRADDEHTPMRNTYTHDFYMAIQEWNTDKIINKHTVLEPDDIIFYINKNPSIKDRRVAMIRKIGMKIYDYMPKRIAINMKYAAVLLINGEKLNTILKQAENISHTKWETDRIGDIQERKTTKNIIESIYSFINEDLKQLVADETKDAFDALDGAFLQLDDEIDQPEKTLEYQDNKYIKATVSQIMRPKVVENKKIARQPLSELNIDSQNANDESPYGKKLRKKEKVNMTKGKSGNAPTKAQRQSIYGIASSKRFMVKDPQDGRYSLFITPASSSLPGSGGIEINIAGETGTEKPEITEACIDSQEPIISNNLITNITFTEKETIEVKLTIKSDQLLTIQANTYETKSR